MPADDDLELDPDRGPRDRPLGFHWTTPNTDLIRSLGVGSTAGAHLQTVNSMLTEAVLAAYEGRSVSYSRHKPFYSATKRYRGASYTYDSVKKAIDELLSLGLIEEDRSEPGQRGRQSTFYATPTLMELWSDAPHVYDPQEVILLKDDHGKLTKYVDTSQTRKWRRDVRIYNEYLKSVSFDFSNPDITKTPRHFIIGDDTFVRRDQLALNRMFLRGSFGLYGRGHGPWQNVPKEHRPQIILNGETVAEPDFKQIHPTMLYHQAGLSPDRDAYDIDGFDRGDVKVAVLVLLNARNYRSAFEAIKGKLGRPVSDGEVHKLITAIKRRHAPIAKSFHSDCGIRLMRPESDIIFDVLNRCVKADIPALSIHDSILTPARQQGRVAEFMEASYASHFPGVRPCEIKLSCPTVPHRGEGGGRRGSLLFPFLLTFLSVFEALSGPKASIQARKWRVALAGGPRGHPENLDLGCAGWPSTALRNEDSVT